MSRVFHISDLHIGHKRIQEFAGNYRYGDDYLENIKSIVYMWNLAVHKKDKVYVHGDVCFHPDFIHLLGEMNGRKVLLRGNHDTYFSTQELLQYFDSVEAIVKYKGYWLTHAPIHPQELRGKQNIHGHSHQNSIMNAYGECDQRYINVCIENTGGAPIAHERIRNGERGWKHRVDKGKLLCEVREQLKG